MVTETTRAEAIIFLSIANVKRSCVIGRINFSYSKTILLQTEYF